MRRFSHAIGLGAGALVVLTLAACTTTSPSPTSTVTTATAATGSASTSSSPTVAASTSASASPTASASAAPTSSRSRGCAKNNGDVHRGSITAEVGDVDSDGRRDTEFYNAAKGIFGIQTASGSNSAFEDTLAGPGRHTAWASKVAGGAAVLVESDGRGAELWALQRSSTGQCFLGAVKNPQGDQYGFDQEELRGHGTGVGCLQQSGALQLGGYDAMMNASPKGTYRVTFTRVIVSSDGRTAKNGQSTLLARAASQSSSVYRTAIGSTCLSTPIVGSDGR